MKELVFKSKHGNPITTSFLVAEKFEKNHKHVLEAIRELIRTAENSAVLVMFYESSYLNSQNKEQPLFYMNRNGFSLLVTEKFGKNHKDVLRDIQNLSCSQEFRERNFALSSYKNRGKDYPMFYYES